MISAPTAASSRGLPGSGYAHRLAGRRLRSAAGSSTAITFLLAWHFPNRYTWTPRKGAPVEEEIIGNWYARRYRDAWDVLEDTVPRLDALKTKTSVRKRVLLQLASREVKEAALFNLSTLRTQTCFRTPDGRFFGWEGSSNRRDAATAPAPMSGTTNRRPHSLRRPGHDHARVEFEYATAENGLMSFRVHLPLGAAAISQGRRRRADGCIMKMFS